MPEWMSGGLEWLLLPQKCCSEAGGWCTSVRDIQIKVARVQH